MQEKTPLLNLRQARTLRAAKKTNCWEFKNCQEAGCPAFVRRKGRSCFAIVGSYSISADHPRCLDGLAGCEACDFFAAMADEDRSFWATLKARSQALTTSHDIIEQTVDGEKAQQILRERARALSQQIEATSTDGKTKVIYFTISGEHFAFDLTAVAEVRRLDGYAPVPCTPPHVVGLINLRGSLLTLFDIRGFLNLPITTVEPGASYIVTSKTVGEPSAILVDTVGGVWDIDKWETRPPLAALKGSLGDAVSGEVTIANRQTTIIDLKAVLAGERLVVNSQIDEIG